MSNTMNKQQLKDYVNHLLDTGTKVITAIKSGYVLARKAVPGETLVTYAGNNGEIIETTNVANEDSWIVSKSNEKGEIIRYSNGHSNSWIADEETLFKKYDLVNQEKGLFKPKEIKQLFIKIQEAISFESPWGSLEYLKGNSYLNITDKNNIYGIQETDFLDTYRII